MRKKWTKEETDFLKENIHLSNPQIACNLGRSKASIEHSVKRLGIRRNKVQISNIKKLNWQDTKKKEKWVDKIKESQNRPEVKEKKSISLKKAWADPIKREQRSKINKESANQPERKKNWIEMLKNKRLDPAYIEKVSNAMKKTYTVERRNQTSQNFKKIWADKDYQDRMHKIHIEIRNRPEIKEKMSIQMKQVWKKQDYKDHTVKKIIAANHQKPTKPESHVFSLVNSLYPNEYKYTGDGEVIIGGKCPDITNVNGQKKVILVHGIYWHLWKPQKTNPNLTKEDVEKVDKEHYIKYGQDCLIIWEDELENTEKVLEKIKEFHGGD